MLSSELRGMRILLAVHQVVDAALPVDGDVLRLVARDLGVAHPAEQIVQHRRVGMGELDELEAVGSGHIALVDLRFGRVVRKGSHVDLLHSAGTAADVRGSGAPGSEAARRETPSNVILHQ